jgi:hypothetical protein
LKQRGVDIPVLSIERRSHDWHRWLMRRIAGLLSVLPDGVDGTLDAAVLLPVDDTTRTPPSSEAPSPPPQLQKPLPLPATLLRLACDREAVPGCAVASSCASNGLDVHKAANSFLDSVGPPGGAQGVPAPRVATDTPSPAHDDTSTCEQHISAHGSDEKHWRWADAVAFCDQGAVGGDVGSAAVTVAEPESGTKAADDAWTAPQDGRRVIQVGEFHFGLPEPEEAMKKVEELFRPGATMVLITGDHNGSPLFCPEGDITKGLINLRSSSARNELNALYWQNLDAPEIAPRHVAVSQSSGRKSAWRRKQKCGVAERLPTHLEEGEEAEEENAVQNLAL